MIQEDYEITRLSFLIKSQWCVYLIILVIQDRTFLKTSMCLYEFSVSTITTLSLFNKITDFQI